MFSRHVEPSSPGLKFFSALSVIVNLLRGRRTAPGSSAGAAPTASTASAAASPGGRHRGGARRAGSGRNVRIRPRGRRPRDCIKRRGGGGCHHTVELSVITTGIRSRFPAPVHRPLHLRHRRGADYSRRTGLRDSISTRVSASAPTLRRQRPARRPSFPSGAPHSASAHALHRRRRAFVRASPQRHQVLQVTL